MAWVPGWPSGARRTAIESEVAATTPWGRCCVAFPPVNTRRFCRRWRPPPACRAVASGGRGIEGSAEQLRQLRERHPLRGTAHQWHTLQRYSIEPGGLQNYRLIGVQCGSAVRNVHRIAFLSSFGWSTRVLVLAHPVFKYSLGKWTRQWRSQARVALHASLRDLRRVQSMSIRYFPKGWPETSALSFGPLIQVF